MKKLNLLLLMFLLAGAVFTTSCTKDEDKTGPSINLKGGTGYTSTDVTVQVEDIIKVGVTGTTDGANFNRFKFSIVSNNVVDVVLDSTFNSSNFNWDYSFAFTSVGEANLTFELFDKDGNVVDESFLVTVEDPAMQINKYLNVTVGSWNDQVGSFYSTTENVVYTRGQLTNVPNNQAKIDFVYFHGVDNKNAIASPDDSQVVTIQDLQMIGWTNKNSTRFNSTNITGAQFDQIGETYQFPTFNMGSQATIMSDLVEGQVILFKTEAGKLGLIKVVDVTNPSRGDQATLSIIVQK